MAKVQVLHNSATMARKLRNPSHDFIAKNSPYSIRPFFLAPVLAGETLKSAQLQMNIQSANLASHLTGWWAEVYFFYVKHRDLEDRDILDQMHVAHADTSSIHSPAHPEFYHQTGIPWARLCTQTVVKHYFRNEDEADDHYDDQGFQLAVVGKNNWLDSAQRDNLLPQEEQDHLIGDQHALSIYEANSVPAGYESHFDAWQNMTRAKLIAVNFDDYLKAHGIRVPKEVEKPHRPELLRYLQDWQIPRQAPYINDPSISCGRVNWKIAERLDKDRFFKEPGFIIGLWVMRPKIYISQAGSATGLLDHGMRWLPAQLQANPETSLHLINEQQAGELFPNYPPDDPELEQHGVWFDVRDLLVYGEQHFSGFGDMADALKLTNSIAGPDVDFMRRYASLADIDKMWLDESLYEETPDRTVLAPKSFVAEGVCRLSIASRIEDTSLAGGQINLPATELVVPEPVDA